MCAYLVNNSTDYNCIDGNVLELPSIVGKPPSRLESRGGGTRPVTSQSQRFNLRSTSAGLVAPRTSYAQRVASSHGYPSSNNPSVAPPTIHNLFNHREETPLCTPSHPLGMLKGKINHPGASHPQEGLPPTPDQRRRSLLRACTPGSQSMPYLVSVTSENLRNLPQPSSDELIAADRERRSFQGSRYSGSQGSRAGSWLGGWSSRPSALARAQSPPTQDWLLLNQDPPTLSLPTVREPDSIEPERELTDQEKEAKYNSLLDRIEEFDDNGDGVISFEEFKKACFKFGKIYSNNKIRQLFKAIDIDGNGTIEIAEFMTSDLMKWDKGAHATANIHKPKSYGGGMGLSNQTSDQRALQVRKNLEKMKNFGEASAELAMAMARSKLQGVCKVSGTQLAKAFKFFDEDNSGSLTRKEFKAAIGYMKIPVKSNVLDQMLDSCDNSGDGLIDYQEFLKIIGGGQNIHKPVSGTCL
eukprot:CAMPEP_0196575680 /NCGR_PEP_ID=MMETSP1081-20130531/5109_1 /TAXON_ID=36882 /ORGANISM="Pyramimonas amylifera, Strain CCMP720" /LENGTH=468 /DNA_ID=CAMNT_0041894053 /DNA_START=174 /DNA_END=1580 /DNA_ORIENTATION=-